MAGGTGDQAARWITTVIKLERPPSITHRSKLQACIIGRDGLALFGVQPLGDPAHVRMVATPVSVGQQLALDITGVESSETRRPGAISPTFNPVASKASVRRAGRSSTQGDHLPRLTKTIGGGSFGLNAACQHGGETECRGFAHGLSATRRLLCRFRAASILPLLLLGQACKPPPEPEQFMAGSDPSAGKAAIERVGCGSCHTIQGIDWPQGMVGPKLVGLSQRGMIAGKLPNRPDVLAAYIRNAPAFVPASAMPTMPVTAQESRDIASYLYEQGKR